MRTRTEYGCSCKLMPRTSFDNAMHALANTQAHGARHEAAHYNMRACIRMCVCVCVAGSNFRIIHNWTTGHSSDVLFI